MAIGNGSGFKTKKSMFTPGFGMVIELDKELPRKFDEKAMGGDSEKGFVVTGKIVSVLGALQDTAAPKAGEAVSVVIRPGDSRKAIFDDLAKTNEGTHFLLEGVTGDVDSLSARWAHGAGSNRDIRALEIVGRPQVSFENTVPDDGPKNGSLRLNLDGSPTVFDVRLGEGDWVSHELPFDVVVDRLKTVLDRGLNFRVSQRVLVPSKAVPVAGQDELEKVLSGFRKMGYTSCVARTFIPGTTDPTQVDVQVLSWPENIEGSGEKPPKVYDMPVLRDTWKFAALRDGASVAQMEVIPGYEVSLVGNPSDSSKSAKHKFVQDIVGKGLSDGQQKLYASQSYGPGISIRAVNDDGVILGLTRLATRTEGAQFRSLMQIPTQAFPDADKLDFTAKEKATEVPESVGEAAAMS